MSLNFRKITPRSSINTSETTAITISTRGAKQIGETLDYMLSREHTRRREENSSNYENKPKLARPRLSVNTNKRAGRNGSNIMQAGAAGRGPSGELYTDELAFWTREMRARARSVFVWEADGSVFLKRWGGWMDFRWVEWNRWGTVWFWGFCEEGTESCWIFPTIRKSQTRENGFKWWSFVELSRKLMRCDTQDRW